MQDVDARLLKSLDVEGSSVVHVVLKCLSDHLVFPLHRGKPVVCFTRGNFQSNASISTPFSDVLRAPSLGPVDSQDLWDSKSLDPYSFQALDELLRAFCFQNPDGNIPCCMVQESHHALSAILSVDPCRVSHHPVIEVPCRKSSGRN